ncbi:MAG: GxxExxY protein [Gemmatimonas sp.]
MTAPNLLYPKLSRAVIGIYYEVHNELRGGLLEGAYQQATEIALTDAGLRSRREVPITATIRGHVIEHYRIDLLVEECIILECKTSDSLSPHFLTQTRNYLRVSGHSLGLILPCGSKAVFQRVVFDRARTPIQN